MDIPASEGTTEPTASLCPSDMSSKPSKADCKPAEGMLLLLSAADAGAAAAAGNAGGVLVTWLVLSLNLGTFALVIGAMLPSFRF
eukprot:5799203-Amphidinium_carterae.1